MAKYATYATLSLSDKQVIYPEVQTIKSLEDRNYIIKNNEVVVIYYHAKWCGPCKTFSNGFNRLAQEFEGQRVIFVKEDVDLELRNSPADPDVVPTFHFYKNGVFQSDKVLIGVDAEKIKNNVTTLL